MYYDISVYHSNISLSPRAKTGLTNCSEQSVHFTKLQVLVRYKTRAFPGINKNLKNISDKYKQQYFLTNGE